jgi:hypothetical protein
MWVETATMFVGMKADFGITGVVFDNMGVILVKLSALLATDRRRSGPSFILSEIN